MTKTEIKHIPGTTMSMGSCLHKPIYGKVIQATGPFAVTEDGQTSYVNFNRCLKKDDGCDVPHCTLKDNVRVFDGILGYAATTEGNPKFRSQ